MKYLLIMLMVCTQGCVLAIKDDFVYMRIGDQKIEGLEVETKEGTKVKLNAQESQIELLKYGIELGKGVL